MQRKLNAIPDSWRLVASGTYANVYLTERGSAMKVMSAATGVSKESVRQDCHESETSALAELNALGARIGARLVPDLIAHEYTDASSRIEMSFIEDTNLEKWLVRAPGGATHESVAGVIYQIASIVHVMNGAGVWHNDLFSRNVMVSPANAHRPPTCVVNGTVFTPRPCDHRVVLIDFGLASGERAHASTEARWRQFDHVANELADWRVHPLQWRYSHLSNLRLIDWCCLLFIARGALSHAKRRDKRASEAAIHFTRDLETELRAQMRTARSTGWRPACAAVLENVLRSELLRRFVLDRAVIRLADETFVGDARALT